MRADRKKIELIMARTGKRRKDLLETVRQLEFLAKRRAS